MIMKIFSLENDIIFSEECINVLQIQDKKLFANVINSLNDNINGIQNTKERIIILDNDTEIKMEKEAWGELIHHCFEHKKNEVNVDGFRKGQVPFDVYVKKFGVESLYMDAVDHALPELYDKLLEENEGLSLNMACRPEVNVKTISEDGLEVVFTVTMKPEVKLGKYKDLGIKKEEVTVTEEEINDELEHLRGHYAEYKEKDGTVENTDEANINFEGFKDGVAFAGGKGENYPLVIGSNSFIPGFEEALIGMKKGETKSIYDVIDIFNTIKNKASRDYIYFTLINKNTLNVVKAKRYSNLKDVLVELKIVTSNLVVNNIKQLDNPNFLIDDNISLVVLK